MFYKIFTAELKRNTKSIAFYLFMGILIFIAHRFSSNVNPNATIMFPIGKAWHNSPMIIARLLNNLSVMGTLFSLVMVARTVVKDFDANIHHFFFTIKMSKLSYLGGRFLGGLLANFLIYLGVVIGFVIGCFFIDPKFSGPFSFYSYVFPMLVLVLPNLFFIGSIFFAMATLSRKMVLTYVAGIAFMMISGITGSMLLNLDNTTIWHSLLDPFANLALGEIYEFWTTAEINNNQVPLTNLLLANRLIWITISFGILFFTIKKFRFEAVSELKRKKHLNAKENSSIAKSARVLGAIPTSIIDNSLRSQLTKLIHLVTREFKRIVFHPAFIILSLFGVNQIYRNFTSNVGPNGSNVYALTSWFLQFTDMGFGFIMPLTILFGGMIVWRERDHKTEAFYDTLPIPDWMSYLSKLFSMMGVQLFFVLLILFTGVLSQAILFNYYNFEFDLYFAKLFGIDLINYWFIAVIVILIQNLSPNKYLGFFFSAAYFIIDLYVFDVMALGNGLFQFGAVPDYVFSNINGFGHYTTVLIWYRIYWALFAIILAVATDLLWRRDNEHSLKVRFNRASQKLGPRIKLVLGSLFVMFTFSGIFIYYNNHIINNYTSDEDVIQSRVNYEKNFSEYRNQAQPEITDMKLNIDFNPNKREVFIKGIYTLKNNTSKTVDKVIINLSNRRISTVNKLELSVVNNEEYLGGAFGFRIFKLEKALQPNDSIYLKFSFDVLTPGFTENNPKDEILTNGTFIRYSDRAIPNYFPVIGYKVEYTIIDEFIRKENGLPPSTMVQLLGDSTRSEVLSGLMNYSAILSTSSAQTAVTNGKLIKQWTSNGKNYFEFRTDTLIRRELVILSGEYKLEEDSYKGRTIKIFYNKKHPYNVERMKLGINRALDYGEQNFGKYPYSEIKIVETANNGIPDGATASSQPTVFTWREDGGFISNLEDPDARDVVFNTTTHEMAHQWWGNTVTPDHREGSGVLIETLAQWVRVMCMENEYGQLKTKDFRKDEMNAYLRGRSADIEEEVSMQNAAFQSYLIYRKGTAVMYALQDYLGEDSVNRALRKIVEKFSLQGSISPTTLDLVKEFRAVAPDSLQYVITDLFEKIVLFDNKVVSANYKKLDNGKYKLNLSVSSKKMESDGNGNETVVSLNDYIDIAVLGEDNKPLYMQKHKFTSAESSFEIIVNELPIQAGIDPHIILIDRNLEDNMKMVELRKE